MPSPPHSMASTRVSLSTPALAAQTCACSPIGSNAGRHVDNDRTGSAQQRVGGPQHLVGPEQARRAHRKWPGSGTHQWFSTTRGWSRPGYDVQEVDAFLKMAKLRLTAMRPTDKGRRDSRQPVRSSVLSCSRAVSSSVDAVNRAPA